MKTASSFFERHAPKFNPLAPGFRECQVGAFCAIRSHFSISHEPCVISLPTGAGKTGLMMAVAFGIRARRVLIISPAEVLRIQTGDKFRNLEDLRLAGAIPGIPEKTGPKVQSIANEMRRRKDWDGLQTYDVLTATTRTTSPGLTKIIHPPEGLFDLVFFDEAHHAAADTWLALIKAFDLSTTKLVLLTGTPYRRDHKSIGPAPRYVYPISQAIADKIYAPVKLITAGRPDKEQRDDELAALGTKTLKSLRLKAAHKVLLMAKTDRTAHADKLGEIYRKMGLNLGVVHSDRPKSKNEAAIIAARDGRSDGLVMVGMLGEGLDIPSLKVAVFHRNPQSLPYTLQIIGRLARAQDALPEGRVIACADDFSRDTFHLFEGSEDWLKLIPQLEQQLLAELAPRHREQVTSTGAEIQLADASTHFSFTAHIIEAKVLARPLQGEILRLQRGNCQVVVDHVVSKHVRAFVTRTEELPRWLRLHGTSTATNTRYDLHVYYLGDPDLVIQQTTDETLADLLRLRFAEKGEPVPPNKLNHVMTMAGKKREYIIVGLKNGAAISGRQTNYKMLLGRRVDGSITNSDRANCHAGHCVSRSEEDDNPDFRGVAYKHARVWSIQRDNLQVLGDWMKTMAELIQTKGDATLPGLEGLRQPTEFVEFPGLPVAALPSADLIEKEVRFLRDGDADVVSLPVIVAVKQNPQRLDLSVPDLELQFSMTIDEGRVNVAENGDSGWSVRVDAGGGLVRNLTIEQFLNEYPPMLVFPDGSSWCDRLFTRPAIDPELNPACLHQPNWDNCDPQLEITAVPATGKSIFEFVERHVIAAGNQDILICDHGTGEVADYIHFERPHKMITLYHCKAAAAKKPGIDQGNLEELVPQCMASCRWITNPHLVTRLQDRLAHHNGTRLVRGAAAEFKQLSDAFEPAAWRFRIVMVQPGLSSAGVLGKNGVRIRGLIACADDYITNSGAEALIFCN